MLDASATAPTPRVWLSLLAPGGHRRIDLGKRLVEFAFEDSDDKTDKVSLTLANDDLRFFESELITKGRIIRVSWGYAGHMAPSRTMVIKVVKGFERLRVEAFAKTVLLNRIQKTRAFENLTRSQICHQVAAEYGYHGPFRSIEDTSESYECINQLGESDARLLTRLARQEGFVFYVDQTGFHWHRRNFGQRPNRVFHFRGDGRQQNSLSISMENDLFAKPGRVRIRGRDPKTKDSINETGSDYETPRDTLGEVLECVAPSEEQAVDENGDTIVKVSPETGELTGFLDGITESESLGLMSSSTAGRSKQQANARYRESHARTIELKLSTEGDPSMLAKTIIELRGVGPFLSGKFYVQSVHHTIGQGGYTMTLACTTDGAGRVPGKQGRNQNSAASPNTHSPKPSDELELFREVDPESGEYRTYQRQKQVNQGS